MEEQKVYMKFDQSRFDTITGANQGVDVRIYDIITKQDTDLVIRVYGQDSDAYKKEYARQQKKRQERMSKGGFRSAYILPTVDEIEQDNLALLARCTISWAEGDKPTITWEGGKELECTFDNVMMFYKACPAIKEQIDVAMGDRANFIKA